MTDQEIRIAVAEACGWTKGRCIEPGNWVWSDPNQRVVGQPLIPLYQNDLNAMHEAEITLTPGFTNQDEIWDKYTSYLDTIAGPGMAIIATARQRAEAFLRTIGKWKEAP